MARMIIEYNGSNIKKTLNICGREFVSNFNPNRSGGMDEDISLLAQIEQSNPKWVEDESIYEEIDRLDFADEDEIQDILNLISEEIEEQYIIKEG